MYFLNEIYRCSRLNFLFLGDKFQAISFLMQDFAEMEKISCLVFVDPPVQLQQFLMQQVGMIPR